MALSRSLALVVATVMGGASWFSSAAYADEFNDSMDGIEYVEDSEAPPESVEGPTTGGIPGQVIPSRDGTTRVWCNDGWRFQVTSHSSTFLPVEQFALQNANYSGAATFNFNASRQGTTETEFSVGVTAEAGNAMFGSVQASVNASVRRSMSYGVEFGGSTRVPPRTIAIAKLGFLRTSATGRSFFRTNVGKRCGDTRVRYATIKAPYMKSWQTSRRPM